MSKSWIDESRNIGATSGGGRLGRRRADERVVRRSRTRWSGPDRRLARGTNRGRADAGSRSRRARPRLDATRQLDRRVEGVGQRLLAQDVEPRSAPRRPAMGLGGVATTTASAASASSKPRRPPCAAPPVRRGRHRCRRQDLVTSDHGAEELGVRPPMLPAPITATLIGPSRAARTRARACRRLPPRTGGATSSPARP